MLTVAIRQRKPIRFERSQIKYLALIVAAVLLFICLYVGALYAATPARGNATEQTTAPVRSVAPSCSTVGHRKWNHLVRLERKIDGFSAHRLRDRPVCVSLYKPFKRHVKQLIRRYCHYAGIKGVKCWIRRAAKKYGQPLSDAMRVADCESDFNPGLTNNVPVGSEYATGLFQFLPSTWQTTPYRHKDIFSARWNAMAAMWMWDAGRRNEWACQ